MKKSVVNKNVLQIICGVLMFLSFFTAWVYNGGLSYYKPTEFIFLEEAPFLFKTLSVLPLLGLTAIYLGYIRRYSYGLNLVCSLVCSVSMWSVYNEYFTNEESTLIAHTGFYMAGLALVVSLASIVIMRKEMREEAGNQE
ncbi:MULTISPECIES: hypothetical protein [unclassified Bacillus (in: firmicutes)]|uniref:hypothetical protein n=1 Tax=unclassified Bacillus (in: firmicutes) TaxID=185979 RepID=UPI0008DEE16F|nr:MULTISPECIES: hypothetical protein [unclassified Bacillus (in: firmicutes)]SFB20182.1 hypothetical protein SAMN02799634_10872 [Bacillus sp. UNCCL13]SFQ90830.1 hypothetical protein SAMN04488577_3887 [Bacillus sp. cl95]